MSEHTTSAEHGNAKPNLFWLLALRVAQGESTPYHAWLLWHSQFMATVQSGALVS